MKSSFFHFFALRYLAVPTLVTPKPQIMLDEGEPPRYSAIGRFFCILPQGLNRPCRRASVPLGDPVVGNEARFATPDGTFTRTAWGEMRGPGFRLVGRGLTLGAQ